MRTHFFTRDLEKVGITEGQFKMWRNEGNVSLRMPGSRGIPSMLVPDEVCHFALINELGKCGMHRSAAFDRFGGGVDDNKSPFHVPQEERPDYLVIKLRDGDQYEVDDFQEGDIDKIERIGLIPADDDRAVTVINLGKLATDVRDTLEKIE